MVPTILGRDTKLNSHLPSDYINFGWIFDLDVREYLREPLLVLHKIFLPCYLYRCNMDLDGLPNRLQEVMLAEDASLIFPSGQNSYSML